MATSCRNQCLIQESFKHRTAFLSCGVDMVYLSSLPQPKHEGSCITELGYRQAYIHFL